MNEYKKLIELEKLIKSRLDETDVNGELSIEVTDTIYYRSFQLRDFFECDEHKFVDKGSVQLQINIVIGDQLLCTFRVQSSELDHNIANIGVYNLIDLAGDLCMNVLDILLPALDFKMGLVINTYASDTSVATLEKSHYKELNSFKSGHGNTRLFFKMF